MWKGLKHTQSFNQMRWRERARSGTQLLDVHRQLLPERGQPHIHLPRVWITRALSFWSSRAEPAPPLNCLGREWRSTPVADINQSSCPLRHPSHFLYFLGLRTQGLLPSILLRLRLNAFVYPCTFLISTSSPSPHPLCDGCICPSALLSPEGLACG